MVFFMATASLRAFAFTKAAFSACSRSGATLFDSLQVFMLTVPMTLEELAEATAETLRRNQSATDTSVC